MFRKKCIFRFLDRLPLWASIKNQHTEKKRFIIVGIIGTCFYSCQIEKENLILDFYQGLNQFDFRKIQT